MKKAFQKIIESEELLHDRTTNNLIGKITKVKVLHLTFDQLT